MATEEPCQPFPPKPLAPAVDQRIVAVQLVADLRPAMTRLQQQDQPGSAPVVRPTAAARRPLVQLHLFCFCQCDPALHEHNHTTFLRVTHHSHVRLSKSQANEFVAFSQAIESGGTGGLR